MIYLIATLDIKPNSIDQLVEAAAPCIAATRQEPGCIHYALHIDAQNPERAVFVEQWKTRQDLTLHFETPHMKVWREAGGPLILNRKIEVIHPEKVEIL